MSRSPRKRDAKDTLNGGYWSSPPSSLKRTRSQAELQETQSSTNSTKAKTTRATKSKAKPAREPLPTTERLSMQEEHYRIRDGSKVAVWYQDRKQYYIGKVTKFEGKKNTYHIVWDSKKEASVWIPLPEDSHTLNEKNTERWCFHEELVGTSKRPTKRARKNRPDSESEIEEEEEIPDESEEDEELDPEESEHSEVEMSLSDSESKSSKGAKASPKKKAPTKPPKKTDPESLWTGEKFKVMVWFNDSKEFYLGEVYGYKSRSKEYHIAWLDSDEPDEWITLKEPDHTLDEKNLERWCYPEEFEQGKLNPITPAPKKASAANSPAKSNAKSSPAKGSVAKSSPARSAKKASPAKASPARERPRRGSTPASPAKTQEETSESAPASPTKAIGRGGKRRGRGRGRPSRGTPSKEAEKSDVESSKEAEVSKEAAASEEVEASGAEKSVESPAKRGRGGRRGRGRRTSTPRKK